MTSIRQNTRRDRSDGRVATRTGAHRAPAAAGDGAANAADLRLRAEPRSRLRACSRGRRGRSRIVAGATQKRLEALAAPLLAQGLDVRTDARWDYPLHEAIIRKAVEWGADLVVKDTHHHSVLRRSIFSNTDWNLIRQCPMQLLLVKPRAIGHVPCIVAAVDPLHPRDKAASLDDRILTSANGARAPVRAGKPMCCTHSIFRR